MPRAASRFLIYRRGLGNAFATVNRPSAAKNRAQYTVGEGNGMTYRCPPLRAILSTAIIACLAAAGYANTTYTNAVNAPVAGNTILIMDDTVYGGTTSAEATE